MKVSVIIPVYGVSRWIAECLESVLLQSYTDWECVLVDDCTMDDSIEIIEKVLERYPTELSQRVRVLKLEQNSGLSVARNRGIEACCGEWIFLLDGDDKFASNTSLEQMIAVAMQYESLDWVQGNFLRVSPSKTWITTYYDHSNPLFDRERIEQRFAKLNFTNATNKLIRRSFLLDNGLWFTAGLIFEDSLWSIQAYWCVKRIATVAEPTYYHNIRESSIMTSGFSAKKVDSMLYIISQSMLLGAGKDKNIASAAVVNTIYLINNLWLAGFEKNYRDSVWQRLELSGVFALSPDRSAFRPFSRLLSFVFDIKGARLRKLWVNMFMGCYKIYKKG